MIYDKENKLYYQITNDTEYLDVKIYKDEYAMKARMLGGLRYFFNVEGIKDTVGVPIVQFPVYKRPVNFESLELFNLSGIPNGELSVYNEYGIFAEAKIEGRDSLGNYHKNKYVYQSSIKIPLRYFKGLNSKNNLAIMIFMRGSRAIRIPDGRVSPIINSRGTNTSSEIDALSLDLDTWTHTWIDYELK
ncbi:hypothetical protein [Sphingobacterium paucimobilis]|uniref:Uncharacterized protein n=1 Tax=Sphingobacterium paucimobilis HER1398 TaxID=1346330 RepID=U2JBW4_9SPHI|nr:hypothetical protein [Sphingobacterium paucimobilis]ERJ60138.1 hypothetical protein M472_15340 [Sphingobacterium paucimobilis HER1398]